MLKGDLRKLYLETRSSLTAESNAELSGQIADTFFKSIDLSGVKTLHLFISIQKFSEIDTSLIYKRIWRERPDVLTVCPRTDIATGRIANIVFDQSTEWSTNRWGIREPLGDEIIDTHQIDLVLVPLLCFDQAGHRIGYGKGMYDRFLAGCRDDCLKVGLSHFPPVQQILDVDENDVRLDICVTPILVSRT